MSLAIGQSPGYINGLENKNGFPSMQVFFYICEYLGVTPAEFLTVAMGTQPNTVNLSAILMH